MRERLRGFSLSLHPDKTRLIEFGRFAAQNCKKRGLAKPETLSAASSRWAPMPISAFDADSIFGRPTRRPAARRHRAVFLNLTSPIRALRST
jgi:hypothetical protein